MYCNIVLTGDSLQKELDRVSNLRKRFIFEDVINFLKADKSNDVGILYGVRRTGKTTLLLQACLELSKEMPIEELAFIYLNSSNIMSELFADLKSLREDGKKYFFIDEITEVEDFSDSCSLLSDYFSGNGYKMLIAGTNSLAFNLVKKHELYDRCKLFDMTWVPFVEYKYLYPSITIDDFLKRSGVASPISRSPFKDKSSTLDYIDTAIAKNINYSLERYRDGECFYSLRRLYSGDMLIGVINRVVQRTDHSFFAKDYRKKFKSAAYGTTRNNIDSRNKGTGIEPLSFLLNETAISNEHAIYLGVDTESTKAMSVLQSELDGLRNHLLSIGVAKTFIGFKNGFEDYPVEEIVFTQPGLRYSVANAAQYAVEKQPVVRPIDFFRKEEVLTGIESDILGRILEDTILIEIMNVVEKNWGCVSFETPYVFRLNYGVKKEIYTVVVSPDSSICYLIEVKHSKAYVPEYQCRRLVDEGICADVTNAIKPSLIKRFVIYTGDNRYCEEYSIDYVNAEEFLLNIDKYII